MRILFNGRTRVVVLAGPYAFKIARIRLLYYFVEVAIYAYRGAKILLTGSLSRRSATWSEKGTSAAKVARTAFVDSLIYSLTCGFRANRTEWLLAGKSEKYDLVPTLCTIGYVVNVQRRGEEATGQSSEGHQVHRVTATVPGLRGELGAFQFCKVGPRCLLADYGNPLFLTALAD